MTHKLIASLAVLTLLLPMGSVPAAPMGQTTTLPPKQAAELYRFYFNPTQQFESIYWTPNAAEVAAAEAALARYAKTPRPRTFGRPKTFVLSLYNRQYAGVRYGGGMRQILINGFANDYSVDPQWHWRAVLVFDGGTSFFHGSTTRRRGKSNSLISMGRVSCRGRYNRQTSSPQRKTS